MATVQIPDNIGTKACGRCGGTGHHSYCSRYGSTCFQCNGSGVMPMRPKNQPRMKTTADLQDCKPGDVIRHELVLYRVESVVWMKPVLRSYGETYNQKVHVSRIVDGKQFTIRRECRQASTGAYSREEKDGRVRVSYRGCYTYYKPTEEEIGQETTISYVPLTAEEVEEAIARFLVNYPQYTREQLDVEW